MCRFGMYTGIKISTFRTSLNIGYIGQFRAIPAGTEKKFFFFNYYYFLSFVIFEFLLGQNDNIFALTY